MSYLPLPLSIVCALLWVYVFAPIALRLFGLRLPMAFYKRAEVLRGLGLGRFISFYGVLTCGVAGFIYFVSNAFFEWTFSTAWTLSFIPPLFNSAWRIFFIFVTSTAFGIFVAWCAWDRPSSSAASSRT
jgi:hypothetical protein